MSHRLSTAAPPPSTPRTLCPADLIAAPELASLAIVEHALHSALIALVAAHPTLVDLADLDEPSSLRLARRLIAATAALERVLDRYRAAVYDAFQPTPIPENQLF